MSDEKRILIMEDSDIFADMLLEFFSSSPWKLERAVNGFEGIKKVYSFMPHLIITDIEMPLFKGYQVTRLLKSRKNTGKIPVIMFTTLGESKDKFWGAQAGADSYIEKSPDNFENLKNEAVKILSLPRNIDFDALERESKKINDNAIIEIVNNLLDNKLFQTTVIGMLTELSDKSNSLQSIINGICDLLHYICEAEIVSFLIRGSKGNLYHYAANFAGFTDENSQGFTDICFSDFTKLFPEFHITNRTNMEFLPDGNNNKKIVSYITFPLAIGGEKFATAHIANAINDYFTPSVTENINVFLSAASPIIANSLSMLELFELQKNTRTAFARYVPSDVMDELINSSSKLTNQSESRNITVLFSDIRNFTSFSEHSSAQDVVEFLNGYFSIMGESIISQGGHIDKFIGDAIMAVFGAVRKIENQQTNAILAAIKMIAELENVNTAGINIPREKFNIGIGINSGQCILGNIGFQSKMDYTIIGDTVNLASRLEGITKFYRYPIIVSENVYNTTKDLFLFRKVDNVRVMGKGHPVGIYAVYSGFMDSADKGRQTRIDTIRVPSLLIEKELLINYNKGLQLFYMKEFKPAQEYFSRALEINSGDYLSQLYLERSDEYLKAPPAENWDGVVTLLEK
jgi:class 3 adenylate cyclase/DNA-binding NarL/FixJ family response regulator